MTSDARDRRPNDPRYEEVRRCLAEADRAFARAGATEDDDERLQLIEEAETWLVRAERHLGRLTDRPGAFIDPGVVGGEDRTFADQRASHRSLVWRRQSKS